MTHRHADSRSVKRARASTSEVLRGRLNAAVVGVILLGLAGCTGLSSTLSEINASIMRPEHVRGTYTLVALNGVGLPARTEVVEATSCPGGGKAVHSEVREGQLILSADGGIVFDANAVLHCRTAAGKVRQDTVPQRMAGSFILGSDNSVRVSLPNGQRMHLAYDSAAAEIRSEQMGALWRRGRVAPATLAIAPERAVQAGLYGLTLVDGDAIPVDLSPLRGCMRRLTGGKLSLQEDGAFGLSTTIHESCDGSAAATGLSYEGTYSMAGGEIRFEEDGRLGTFQGTAGEGSITLPLGGLHMTFRAGASVQTDPAAAMLQEVQEGIVVSRPPGSYDCAQDPVLTQAPAIPAVDTTGMGVRVAAAFPGYHLSTEREIACRFPLADGTSPSTYVEEFGTGRTWWVQRADFDRDDREDVLTVLTSDSDPSQDRLVALFANGQAAEVASLGGWGFSADEDEHGPFVYVIYWKKGAVRYRWVGDSFVSGADPDASNE